ncbi:MAG: UDP-N-acetylmuramoyl-L-alanyl-D-glutamate--2,6-diaminopimelate ligase, partial [Chloroflexota bacterium]|nr:UDP-N-acetylmuramoyl-L-alanyl-D-glutamate--2,6-diaminopimelate ligase [Chloroflexota bacterium]
LLHRRGQLASEPLPAHGAEADPALGAVRYDSRRVAAGDLFVACRGQHVDGHEHVPAAIASGAVAIIVERPLPGVEIPQLVVRDARASLALAAAWRAGDPSRSLGIVGITGTDGKTTTAYLVRAILEAAGQSAGLLGTTDVIVAGESLGNAARTSTPEAPELQGYLADMRAGGDRWAVVESSSHGLAQQRVGCVAYDVAVLTNVTSEHLEFHGTLNAYRSAKRSLFARLAVSEENPEKGWGKHAVVNADDPESDEAAAVAAEARARVWRYGLAGSLGEPDPGDLDIAATAVEETPSGMRIRMQAADWSGTVTLRLAGRFNIHNTLAAMGVAAALGLDLDGAAHALAELEGVPGRMQRIDGGQPFSLVIDYAHTADALAKVLDELRPTVPGGGLIAVFGSAGDRDASKREPMGRVAGERCRLVVVTDEDPRSEDRGAILDAIAAGAEAAGKRRGDDLLVIPDRAEAIARAVRAARPGDAVLLAGKGHEKTIETATGEVPWDEAAVAREALEVLDG